MENLNAINRYLDTMLDRFQYAAQRVNAITKDGGFLSSYDLNNLTVSNEQAIAATEVRNLLNRHKDVARPHLVRIIQMNMTSVLDPESGGIHKAGVYITVLQALTLDD